MGLEQELRRRFRVDLILMETTGYARLHRSLQLKLHLQMQFSVIHGTSILVGSS